MENLRDAVSTSRSPTPEPAAPFVSAELASQLSPASAVPPSPPAAPAYDPYAALRLTFGAPLWLRQNPALALTIGYLLLTIVGMAYTWALYRRLGVDVLNFAETSDFLMVVLREPLVMVLVLAPIPFYMVYGLGVMAVSKWIRRKVTWLDTWSKRYEARYGPNAGRKLVPATAFTIKFLFLSTYALLFVLLYSRYQAERIRAADTRKVTVEFKPDTARGASRTWEAPIVGTTTRFVFFYDAETKRVEAVPLEAIARLRFPPRRPAGAPATPSTEKP